MRKFTNKELHELEQRSFENLVRFYEKELLMLASGRKVQLSNHTIKMLKKRGVLDHGRRGRQRTNFPSDRAMQILERFSHSRAVRGTPRMYDS